MAPQIKTYSEIVSQMLSNIGELLFYINIYER